MRKTLGIILSVSLAFSVLALPIFAADTTTSATVGAQAPAAPTTGAPAPSVDTSKLAAGSYYTVVSGDVFWKIAANSGLTVDALAKLNPQIKNINLIYPGDVIIVKKAAEAPAAPAAPAAPEQPKIDKAPYEAAQNEGYEWETKREEGYAYDMTHKISKGAADNASGKEWFEQLDYYESLFMGKTVAEVEAWFDKYTDVNGRPFKMAYPEKLTDSDKTAVAALTDAEKQMLVDVTTGATMALQDPHSRFIEALQEASESKKLIAGQNLYLGIGSVANYRIRNGNNDNLNVTNASVIFDEAGKIVDLEWDVLEITPSMFQWLPAQK